MGANATTPQKWGKKSWFEAECFFSFSFSFGFFLQFFVIWHLVNLCKNETPKLI
jgi:hypothetical protein